MVTILCSVCQRINTFHSLSHFSQSPKRCSACNSVLNISHAEIPTDSDRDDDTDPEFVLVDDQLKEMVSLPSVDDSAPKTTPVSGQDTPAAAAHPPLDPQKVPSAAPLAIPSIASTSALPSSSPSSSSGFASTSAMDPGTTFQSFKVTYADIEKIPEYVDFETKDSEWSEWVKNHRLEVIAELPIEPASDDEISIPITIKTNLDGTRVAVWLRRGNTIGNGLENPRYTTESPCQVSIKLERDMRHFELCIRPNDAKNWLWCVTVPILRRTDIDKVPRNYQFDQTRQVASGATVLEGYTNNQITIVDNAVPQATTRQFGLILEPLPYKPRTRIPKRIVCPRRRRPVSEYTLQCGDKRWQLHGGSGLTFGKDKPLADRDNQNDMVFRPHSLETVWGQVSRTHGIFEVEETKVFYKHAVTPGGKQQSKRIKAVFPDGKTVLVTQPDSLEMPDPLEKVRFFPVLSVDPTEAGALEIQAWRNSVDDHNLYSLALPTQDSTPGTTSNLRPLAGLIVRVLSPDGKTVREHFLISKSLIIGSAERAQIQVQGAGIRSFHGYIHWVDNHLWLEAYNSQCQIKVDGQLLYVNQLCPLTEDVEVVLGDSTVLQILHYG